MRWTLGCLLLAGSALMASQTRADEATAPEPAPIVCRLDAFDEQQLERSLALRQVFTTAVTEVRELPNGYAFGLGQNADAFVQLAEWVTLERKCCPFFEFALVWKQDSGGWLELTGGENVKSFIATVFLGQKSDE